MRDKIINKENLGEATTRERYSVLFFKLNISGYGDGSVGKVFAMQA